jgi:hypothetical protein
LTEKGCTDIQTEYKGERYENYGILIVIYKRPMTDDENNYAMQIRKKQAERVKILIEKTKTKLQELEHNYQEITNRLPKDIKNE